MQAAALATYNEWAAYRSQMAVSLFVGPVYFLTQLFIWRAVFSTRACCERVHPGGNGDLLRISMLIGYLTFDSADWDLQMLVRTGGFITFRLRPVSYCFYAFCQKVGHQDPGVPGWSCSRFT